MADKYRAQARFVIEVGLKREDAKHEVQKARHFFDAAAIPGPYLGADVVNDLLSRRLFSQCASEAQIEPRVIDQHDRVGFALLNLVKGFVKLFSKVTVLSDHFPQAEDGCVIDPVFELLASDLSHLWPTASDELKIGIPLAQRIH